LIVPPEGLIINSEFMFFDFIFQGNSDEIVSIRRKTPQTNPAASGRKKEGLIPCFFLTFPDNIAIL